MKRYISSVLVLFAVCANASDGPRSRAVYADTGFFNEGLENGGLGLGFGVEQRVVEHLSVQIRHGIIHRDTINHTLTIVSFAFYPKSVGLEGFNAAVGMGYSDTQIVRTGEPFYQKIFPFVSTSFGYKVVFWNRMILEPYFNWVIPLTDVERATTGIHALVDIFGINLGLAFD